MKIINLTPHAITLFCGGDEQFVFPADAAGPARVEMQREPAGLVNGIPVSRVLVGEVYGLPEPAEDTVFIVSRVVAEACPLRHDLFITDGAVRDQQGRVVGCTGFARCDTPT
ncbi:MAG: hypothetical protein M1522_01650 [Actinobacteria bacterium]|nr:hypothetical protein [Actinomycetota bacterium]